VSIDRDVTGQEPDTLFAIFLPEVEKLLVGQSLERRCIETTLMAEPGHFDRIFGNHRLARSGRRADDHTAPLLQVTYRLELKIVEFEWEEIAGVDLQFGSGTTTKSRCQ